MERKPPYELSQEELTFISQYLRGELDTIEHAAFERRLQTDHVLQQKVEEVNALLIGVREANLADLLDEWHEETATVSGRTPVRLLRHRWWVAASVAVLVLFGVWWLSESANERLYQAYFEPDKGLPVVMSSTDTVSYTLYDGMISYKEGDYTDALAKWTKLADNTGYTDTLRYYIGMAHLNNDDTEVAIVNLMEVVKQDRSVFHDRAVWYLALCYLKQGDKQTTISFLKRIRDDEGAQQLLKKIE